MLKELDSGTRVVVEGEPACLRNRGDVVKVKLTHDDSMVCSALAICQMSAKPAGL